MEKTRQSPIPPPAEPGLIQVPAFPYFTLQGEGNPNGSAFAEAVAVLYSLSYTVKMLPKKAPHPKATTTTPSSRWKEYGISAKPDAA